MSEQATAGGISEEFGEASRLRDRILLTAGIVACGLIFWGMGKVLGIPQEYGFDVSLLKQPSPTGAMLATWVTLIACVALASLIAGVVHFEAGLYCAAVGMAALSCRGGPMRYVMFDSSGPRMFITEAVELILLYGALGVAWLGLLWLKQNRFLRSEESRDPAPPTDEEPIPTQGALALVTQVFLTIVLMSLLCQTDKKQQVLAAVCISSWLAALGAHSVFPVRPAAWFWIAPLFVGVLGYGLASVGEGYWTNGEIFGMDPALARPLPLDYASLGTAGAILGYWTSRRWHASQHDPENPHEVEQELDRPMA